DGATWWDVSQFVQLISIGESSRWELTGTVAGGSLTDRKPWLPRGQEGFGAGARDLKSLARIWRGFHGLRPTPAHCRWYKGWIGGRTGWRLCGDGRSGTVVRFENVGLRYGLGPEVLRDLSFRIEPHSFQFLTGPSGAGKTTLMRLLFLALRPTRGL